MSAKQRFLRDTSGAVAAEWAVMGAVALTLCLSLVTALGGTAMAATGL